MSRVRFIASFATRIEFCRSDYVFHQALGAVLGHRLLLRQQIIAHPHRLDVAVMLSAGTQHRVCRALQVLVLMQGKRTVDGRAATMTPPSPWPKTTMRAALFFSHSGLLCVGEGMTTAAPRAFAPIGQTRSPLAVSIARLLYRGSCAPGAPRALVLAHLMESRLQLMAERSRIAMVKNGRRYSQSRLGIARRCEVAPEERIPC